MAFKKGYHKMDPEESKEDQNDEKTETKKEEEKEEREEKDGKGGPGSISEVLANRPGTKKKGVNLLGIVKKLAAKRAKAKKNS